MPGSSPPLEEYVISDEDKIIQAVHEVMGLIRNAREERIRMATILQMPKLGFSMTEGKIIGWMKNEGEEITAGDAILTVGTDKVNYDIEAPESGILSQDSGEGGSGGSGGAPMAIIIHPGESVPAEFGEGSRGGLHAENPIDKSLPGG